MTYVELGVHLAFGVDEQVLGGEDQATLYTREVDC